MRLEHQYPLKTAFSGSLILSALSTKSKLDNHVALLIQCKGTHSVIILQLKAVTRKTNETSSFFHPRKIIRDFWFSISFRKRTFILTLIFLNNCMATD